jgi:hypothetical protein
MGRIETQVEARSKALVGCLMWYIKAMDTLERSHAREVNDLNRAFNERMAELKAEPNKKGTRKKSVNKDDEPKKE